MHYLDGPSVELQLDNTGIRGETDYSYTDKEDIREVVVNYEEEGTGKDLASSDTYKGYAISMIRQFEIAPKTIKGYEVVKEPEINLDKDTVTDKGRTYTYTYRKVDEPEPTPIPDPKPAPVKVKKVKVTGLFTKIAAGKKVKLTATVSPANAANKAVTWKSSNTKVAMVDKNGNVTVKKNTGGKKVTITATAKDGSKVKASYTITSMKGIVKKISISGAKSVKAGKTLKLKAKVTASKGANKTVRWTSSNTKYATVTVSGKVTAKKAGKGKKVKITVTATDGSNKKKTVTVKIK